MKKDWKEQVDDKVIEAIITAAIGTIMVINLIILIQFIKFLIIEDIVGF